MRNLKRALSLTLASVMLLGMMVIGTSAASYPDVDKDNNVEAIEVLQAVGVMQGDDKGNFDPDRTVSRNEMAIVMAKLLNLDYNYYSESCPFWDVPDYAKPYVGACFANGIVSGYSATQYGGSDTVTAVQAASMMMRALGYFQHESDYADGFVISTVRQASKIGLFKDINASQESPLTRDQVAQLALNTLESGMVEAQKSSSDITIGSGDTAVTINGAVSYVYVTSGDSKFNTAIDDIKATSIGTINDSYIVELGEKLYNGDLKKYGEETNSPSNESDDFGRPAVTWTYKNDKVGTYAKKNELVASYDKKVSKGDLYSLLSSAVRSDLEKVSGASTLTVHVNGEALSDPNAEVPAIGKDIYARNNSTAIYTPVTDSTRRGTVTEVYVDKDNNVDIVIVDTFVYQATSDYSSSRDDVKIAPVGDTADAITLKSSETTLKGEDFDITDIKADDYLLITAASATGSDFEVKSVAVAEKVEGEVTAWTSGDSVTINGTKYEYSATALKTADGVRNTQYTVGQSAIVVVDTFGNIIAVDEAVASSSYVFVKEFGGTSGLNKKAVADAYFTDATNEEINVDRVGSIKSASTIAGMGEVNKWYTYSKNSDGKYVLYDVPARYTADSATKSEDILIQNGKVAFLPGKTSALANDKTILVLVDKDGDVMTYTGTSAIPDVKNMTTSPVVHYLLDSDGYVDYAFVDLENSGAQIVDGGEDTSFMYVLRFDGENYAGNATTYYTYKTIDDENGEEITTNFDAKIAPVTMDGNTRDNDHPYTLYYKPRYNSDEEITNLSEITDGDGKYFDKDRLTQATVSYGNGSLRVGANNFIVNNSSKIYLVAQKDNAFMADSTKNHEIDRVTGTELASTLKGYAINGSVSGAFVSDSSNVVDTMYITVKSSVGYNFDDVTVSPTALTVAKGSAGTFEVTLPAKGKTLTSVTSADTNVAKVSKTTTGTVTTVTVTPVAKNGTTTIDVVVTDGHGISMTYQVRVTVTGFAAPTTIVGGLTGGLGNSFKDPRITDAQGNPKSTANVGETVQVVIEQKPAPVTRAVGGAATTFEKDQYYKVTLGADSTEKTVQCKEAGKLVVEYQVVTGDLTGDKITVNVSAIVSTAAPVDPPAKYTVTGITDATEVTGGDSMTFTVASDKASAAKDEEVTLTATLNKVVPDGKKVTVTFTAPTGKTIEIAAGNKTGTVKFAMGEANVTVAATAAQTAASVEDTFDATQVTIDSAKSLEAGATTGNTVTANITNSYATIGTTVASSDEEVATATATAQGVITIVAKKAGTANLTVTATKTGGTATKDYTIAVTVTAVDFTENTAPSDATLDASSASTADYTVTLATGFEIKAVSSSDEAKATVAKHASEAGKVTVTAVANGEATITVTVLKTGTDPEQTHDLTFKVTVTNKA